MAVTFIAFQMGEPGESGSLVQGGFQPTRESSKCPFVRIFLAYCNTIVKDSTPTHGTGDRDAASPSTMTPPSATSPSPRKEASPKRFYKVAHLPPEQVNK